MALTESDITKVVTKPAIAPTDTFLFNQGGTGPFQVSYNAVVSALQASLDSRYAAKGTTGSLTLGGVLGTANVITDQTTTVITNVTTVASNASSSNPVTAPRTGLRTFNIHNVAELDALPMGSLQAGDVVNIFYNATPYNRIVRISNQGTAAQPIVIWGVTDANGNRPVFTGRDARTTPGSMPGGTGNVWNNTSTLSWQYREGIAIMGTACKASDPWGTYRPEHVQFYNFELTGARRGGSGRMATRLLVSGFRKVHTSSLKTWSSTTVTLDTLRKLTTTLPIMHLTSVFFATVGYMGAAVLVGQPSTMSTCKASSLSWKTTSLAPTESEARDLP
jgi:hypothetical protein